MLDLLYCYDFLALLLQVDIILFYEFPTKCKYFILTRPTSHYDKKVHFNATLYERSHLKFLGITEPVHCFVNLKAKKCYNYEFLFYLVKTYNPFPTWQCWLIYDFTESAFSMNNHKSIMHLCIHFLMLLFAVFLWPVYIEHMYLNFSILI